MMEKLAIAETYTQELPLVVGVDLGGTQLRAAVLRGQELLSRDNNLIGEDSSPFTVIRRMEDSIRKVVKEAGVSLDDIKGIGIGAPGPLDSQTGVIFSPPNLHGWIDIPLRDILHKTIQKDIYLENDANVAGLGEFLLGTGKGSQDMVYITVSTGIGGGVIIGGEILTGVSGTAAELGHMTIKMDGPLCNCGNIGCLEAISSGTAIAKRANELIAAGQGEELKKFAITTRSRDGQQYVYPEAGIEGTINSTFAEEAGPLLVDAQMVSKAAAAGIQVARQIIHEAAVGLGFGLVNVINIFNPSKIILGGGVMQMGDLILKPALEVVERRAMRTAREAASIEVSTLGHNVGLIGAGALVYYHQQIFQTGT